MRTSAKLSVLILFVLMGCAGCESTSWQTYEGEAPEWARPAGLPNTFVPVYGVGIGAFWTP